jgi:3-isopropylmalate/(R)-2-methylmalate dehydratase small subunit
MQPFTTLTSKVIPLPIRDVDTDMIIPAQFLTSISREGFGPNLFRRLRDTDPNFALTQPQYKGAEVLVADSNFGCGSSREHAVWALQDAGFRVVISKSFADIFYNNSAKNGLLLVVIAEDIVDRLLKESAAQPVVVTVNLEAQTVTLPWGASTSFDFDPFRKHCLLNGLDDIEYMRSHRNEVEEFRKRQQDLMFLPVTTR